MGSIGSDGVDRDRVEFCRRNCTAGYHDDPQCYWAGSANTVTYQSAVFCEHANECPTSACRCNIDCACREHMCKLPDLAAHNERCNHWLGKQCTCRYRAGGMTMGETKAEEWSIKDEATGEWWGVLPGKNYSGWGAPEAVRYANHSACATCGAFDRYRAKAVIVPAPPKPMSDAEARECLTQHSWSITGSRLNGESRFTCWREPVDEVLGYGPTIEDAIRAAAKALGK